MPVDPALAGRTFVASQPYDVSVERIRAFAEAIGAPADGDDGVAPFTFPMVVAFRLMTRLMTDPTVGIELHDVVHRDQRIEQSRPVRAGDRLDATLVVESVRSAAGVDLIATRTSITAADGSPVAVATATLVHRGAGSGEPA